MLLATYNRDLIDGCCSVRGDCQVLFHLGLGLLIGVGPVAHCCTLGICFFDYCTEQYRLVPQLSRVTVGDLIYVSLCAKRLPNVETEALDADANLVYVPFCCLSSPFSVPSSCLFRTYLDLPHGLNLLPISTGCSRSNLCRPYCPRALPQVKKNTARPLQGSCR